MSAVAPHVLSANNATHAPEQYNLSQMRKLTKGCQLPDKDYVRYFIICGLAPESGYIWAENKGQIYLVCVQTAEARKAYSNNQIKSKKKGEEIQTGYLLQDLREPMI
jgi:hypothetical protein